MPRPNNPRIEESAEMLASLRNGTRSAAAAHALEILLLLRERPDVTSEVLADQVGCSVRTIQRCLARYQIGGIGAVLNLDPVTQANVVVREEELDNGLEGELAARWLFRLVRRMGAETDPDRNSILARDELLRFLNRPDRCAFAVESGTIFRRVGDAPTLNLMHLVDSGTGRRVASEVRTGRFSRRGIGDVLTGLQHSGRYVPAEFHPPFLAEYHLTGGCYIGGVILLANRDHFPISHEIIDRLRTLDGAILSIMTDISLRMIAHRPLDAVFSGMLDRIARDGALGQQELRVLALQLMGNNYGEIAERIGLKTQTVANYIHVVHKKLGITNLADLLARYLTPVLGEAPVELARRRNSIIEKIPPRDKRKY